MKTGIAGAGALGSLFAYKLYQSGIHPVIYEKNENTASALVNGLFFEDSDGIKNKINIKEISSSPSILKNCDTIFLFIKSYATEDVMKSISPLISPDTIIVTLQNGLGNFDIISRYIPVKNILYGTTTTGATKTSPDTVRFGGAGTITLGGEDKSRLQGVTDILLKADFSVTQTDEPERTVWEKAVINAAINPLGALLKVSNGKLEENNETREIMKNIIDEAVRTAGAYGINLDKNVMIETTMTVCKNTYNNLCSMLQDINEQRKTEINSINGKIADFGERKGLQLPVNRTITGLVKSLESFGSSRQ